MDINKTDTPILEQIERPPQTEGVEQVRDLVKLELHAAALLKQTPTVAKVCETSEIGEDRIFSKEDIAKLIVFFAMTHKLELADLKVSKIINNEQETLLVLEVQSPNSNGGHQLINYTIKGRHGMMQSQTTSLDRTFWDADDVPEAPYGGIVAEYLDGKWHFED